MICLMSLFRLKMLKYGHIVVNFESILHTHIFLLLDMYFIMLHLCWTNPKCWSCTFPFFSFFKMALLNYPTPDLDATLQEVDRVLQLILSPDLYSDYRSTVEEHRELLQESHKNFATSVGKQENWVTENFKRNLLSCCDPLPSSTALPFILLPTQVKQCTQLWRAAALLWAAAKLHCEPTLLEGSTSLERTQQSQLFAASRIPGRVNDEIKVRPQVECNIQKLHGNFIISRPGLFWCQN